MIPEKVKNWAERVSQPLVSILVRASIPPNLLTWLGFVFAGGAGFLLSQGMFRPAAALIIIGGIFDILDGQVARTSRKVTGFGKFLDSAVDRYSEFVVLLGPFLYYLFRSKWLSLLTVLAMFGSFMVSYARARAEGIGEDCRIGVAERPERVIVLVLGALSGVRYFHFFLWLLVLLAHFTFIQRAIYIWRRMRG